MDTFRDDWQWSFNAIQPLKVIIVGAGIAGLTAAICLKKAGHVVLILEQGAQITEVGAGIQVAPNASRILGRLGLLEQIMAKANALEMISLRRWQDDTELGTAPLMPSVGERYHAPLSVIHRSDLQSILLQAVNDLGVAIRLSSKVIRVDPLFLANVQLENGDIISGDIVLCADGVKSTIRRQMAAAHGIKDHACPTGDAAYRILIPKELMLDNDHALSLLAENVGTRWMGPNGHIMAYPIKNNTVYNMVLLHPDKISQGTEESWTSKGDKKEMMEFYKDWNQTVKDLISYVPEGEVMEWTLNSHLPLPTWIENQCVLLGDACHPMLPYVAQGAAQAIEDAAVLTCVLSLIESKSQLPTALKVYEGMRKERAERIQNSAAANRTSLHLPDGEAQMKRDAAMRRASGGKDGGKNPDLWADNTWQDFMWGVDVMKDVVENWHSWLETVEGKNENQIKPYTAVAHL